MEWSTLTNLKVCHSFDKDTKILHELFFIEECNDIDYRVRKYEVITTEVAIMKIESLIQNKDYERWI